jgi:hypothetical protein
VDEDLGATDGDAPDRRFCWQCGTEMEADSAFCPACGTAVEAPQVTGEVLAIVQPLVEAPIVAYAESGGALAMDPLTPAYATAPAVGGDVVVTLFVSAGIALVLGALATLAVGGLATIRSLDPYLVVLADLAYALPILIGLAAGYSSGSRQTAWGRTRSWIPPLVGALVAVVAVVLIAQSAGGYLAPLASTGWLAVGAPGSPAVGWILVLLAAGLSAFVGWRAGLLRRPLSLAVLALGVSVLALTAPMLTRIYQLMQTVGGLR